MANNTSDLNINQRQAVEWDRGPLLVLAGPGSGKTLVLTLRIARLIRASKGKRFRILGLTFTTKAASEMKERVDQLVPEATDRVSLSTFHSFSAEILRQHGSHVGIKPDFTILNQPADRQDVMQDAIRELIKSGQEIEDSDIQLLPLVDNLMEKLVPETEVASHIRDAELGRKLSLLYTEFRRQLVSNNRLDFLSLLTFAYELLITKPAVASHIRLVYPHICVDEFQDTNLAQYKLLRQIVGDSPTDLFVVADDDQIIYQWNGASPERLEELRQDYKMTVVQLPVNYRCPPSVIKLANNLIAHNMGRPEEKLPLAAMKESEVKNVVRILDFENATQELRWIADDISKKPAKERGECVILGRTRNLVEGAARELNEKGIPAAVVVRKNEFDSAPLRWLHAVLRLASARGDREQLRRICKSFYELEGVDLRVQDVTAASSATGGDLLRAWVDEALARRELEDYTRNFLQRAKSQIVERLQFIEFIRDTFAWCEKVELRLAGSAPEIPGLTDWRDERETWRGLQESIVKRFGSDDLTLNIVLQEIDLSPKVPSIPKDAVRCFTIHTAKGMEFENVYLIGLAEDQLPSFQSIKKGDQSREMQEERRNCFVAITRTRATLTLTYSRDYNGWSKSPSRFLHEMGVSVLTKAV